jgi:DNA-directed RNA polymerase I, II, and III subunit RPABC2
MSDNESDYYSDSSESNEEETFKANNKKPLAINAAKKFGNYMEDESEVDDSELDDAEGNNEEDDNDVEEDNDIVEEDDLHIDDDNEQLGGDQDDADEDGENEDDDEIEINDEGVALDKKPKPMNSKKTTQLIIADDDDDEDEYDENYLQKFDNEITKNYIQEFHPECLNHNSDEVAKLSKVIRDENNIIIDPLHRTIPYLTKYEKARILGQRAKQIETGSKPFVKVPENVIDSYVIAELELREKKIPFIIKRPIPGGAFEYWNLRDLEIINF